eukprot:scaffold80556_cov55-Phaeocystis_antarctica.AAC.1
MHPPRLCAGKPRPKAPPLPARASMRLLDGKKKTQEANAAKHLACACSPARWCSHQTTAAVALHGSGTARPYPTPRPCPTPLIRRSHTHPPNHPAAIEPAAAMIQHLAMA